MPATEATVMHEVKIDGDDIYVRLERRMNEESNVFG
jgi:hypothetical protein